MAFAAAFGVLLLAARAHALTAGGALGVRSRPAAASAAAAIRMDAGKGDGYYAMTSDLLMKKSVDFQINAFGMVRDVASKTFMANTWEDFLRRQITEGCALRRARSLGPTPPRVPKLTRAQTDLSPAGS